MEDDAMSWAGTNFFGGVAGYQEGPCGAVSGIGIALGFQYRDFSGDAEKVRQSREKAIRKAEEILKQFKEAFGSIICIDLVGVDFSDPEKARRFMEDPDNHDRCPGFVRFAVEKMLEPDDEMSS
ncbi:MAG: C_GCAxxG_C_C family protein [Dehalococcoidales bacterium]|nr:C_GCAxxG_C_C family protein [Dehalococcoidales bacterium]